MDNSFFAYAQLMELISFFSGYPLLYVIVHFIFENQSIKNKIKSRIVFLLPLAYALVGTLYLGLQIKNLYPDISLDRLQIGLHRPFLMIWGILSVLFWFPVFRKKTIWSLFHSFVFFFFILRDVVFQMIGTNSDKEIIANDMKIYTVSLFVNLGAFLFIILSSFIISQIQNRSKTHSVE